MRLNLDEKNLNSDFSLILQGCLFEMNSLICSKSYSDIIDFDFWYAHHITKFMTYGTYFYLEQAYAQKFLNGLISYILATWRVSSSPNKPTHLTLTHHILLFPDAIHHSILYSFRDNTLLKIPWNIAYHIAQTNSMQWMSPTSSMKSNPWFLVCHFTIWWGPLWAH